MMNFSKNDLLNYTDFMLYARNNFSPYDKSLIVSKKLKEYCFFNKNTLFYCFDGSNEFRETEINTERYILTIVSAYLAQSVKHLTDDNYAGLNLIPCFNSICENESILKYMPQLMVMLQLSDAEIDYLEDGVIAITATEIKLDIQELNEEVKEIKTFVLADGETYIHYDEEYDNEDDELSADELLEFLSN